MSGIDLAVFSTGLTIGFIVGFAWMGLLYMKAPTRRAAGPGKQGQGTEGEATR